MYFYVVYRAGIIIIARQGDLTCAIRAAGSGFSGTRNTNAAIAVQDGFHVVDRARIAIVASLYCRRTCITIARGSLARDANATVAVQHRFHIVDRIRVAIIAR